MSYNKTEPNRINKMMFSCSIKAKGLASFCRIPQHGTIGRETAELFAGLDHNGATYAGFRRGAQFEW